MSLEKTTLQDFERFAHFVKNNKDKDCPEEFKELLYFYNALKDFTKVYGKQIMDMAELTAKRFRNVLPAISDEDYFRIIGDLSSYEFFMNRQDWPDFQTPTEIRIRQVLELHNTLNSKAEKEHFSEEFYNFLSQGEDIAGASYRLMPLEQLKKKIKKKKERA